MLKQVSASSTGSASSGTGLQRGDGAGGFTEVTLGTGLSFTSNTLNATAVTWNNVTGATQALVANNGYVSNNAGGAVAYTLPATASVLTIIEIVGSLTGWSIAQNALQSIVDGANASTIGVTGSVSSTLASDSIRLICITANTKWSVISSQGNLTVA